MTGAPHNQKLEAAIDAIEAACPGFEQDIMDSGVAIVSLEGIDNEGAGQKESQSEDQLTAEGVHDHDTIALNFELVCSPAVLGGNVWHEFQHSQNATSANTDADPTTGSYVDDSTWDSLIGEGVMGLVKHLELYEETYKKMCDAGNAGAEVDSAECEALKGGFEIGKSEALDLINSTSDQVDAAESNGSILSSEAEGAQGDLDDALAALNAACHDMEDHCDCP